LFLLTIDLHLHLLYCKCTLHVALKAPPIICMSRREMDDEGLPWSSPKRKSHKYAKNGEEMMDILVDDIDRYEQLMLQDRLHWFGKHLTCSCYVAYGKFSHNVTFYEKIQISLFSTKFSYCRSIIVNLIQTFLRTCCEILIEKYFSFCIKPKQLMKNKLKIE
jgi:hypothetical protein